VDNLWITFVLCVSTGGAGGEWGYQYLRGSLNACIVCIFPFAFFLLRDFLFM